MDNNDLQRRVEELEKWKADRTAQQVTYPLDIQSQEVLGKYFLSKVTDVIFYAGVGANLYKYTIVKQDGKVDALASVISFTSYIANTTANTLALASARFEDDNVVTVISSDNTPPSPLVSGNIYFVVNASSGGTVIQLSLTQGGAAIDITTTGTGPQYIYLYA